MDAGVIFLFSLLIATVASTMRRSGLAWFFISLIITPLFAGIILAVIGRPTE